MSLSGILKQSGRENLRNWFKYHFPNPGLGEKLELIVPPSIPSNPNPGEVGTALDYLIRFHLERLNKKVIYRNSNWIAEIGLNSILSDCDTTIDSHMMIGTEVRSEIVEVIPFREKLINVFEKAKRNHSDFIKTGKLTTKLIKSSIFLSKLDVRYRYPVIDVNILNIDKNAINELKELLSIVPWDKFKAKKHCYLNPNFGDGTKFVRGADADLIIDGVIVDMKSTKDFKIDRKDLNQIIGYFLLSHIDYINGNEKEGDIKIKEIAIYFARYGYFWRKPLSDFYELEKYDKLTDEFMELVRNPRLDLVKDKPKRNSLNLPDNLSFS